ncbi:RNA polymerase sigma factor [Microbacterium sp.]|uniref:RNA polymerase sigma factor n=1 Tax=Microbacterium sp. TaxID=51671 RepID=UPI003F9A95A3
MHQHNPHLTDTTETPEYDAWFADELMAARDRMKSSAARTLHLASWHAIVDDVVSESIVSAWRSRYTFDPEKGKIVQWVTRIARNRAIDWAQKNNRELTSSFEDHDGEHLDRVALRNATTTPADAYDHLEKLDCLSDWVKPVLHLIEQVMPPKKFHLAVLYHLYDSADTTVQEAAVDFGVSGQALREYVRIFNRHCAVINLADACDLTDWTNTTEAWPVLLGCLPEPEQGGLLPVGDVSRILDRAGGDWNSLDGTKAALLLDDTPLNTGRQYWKGTQKMLDVAAGRLPQRAAGVHVEGLDYRPAA